MDSRKPPAGDGMTEERFVPGSWPLEGPKRNGIPTRRLGRIPYDATVIGVGGWYLLNAAQTHEEGAELLHSVLGEGVNYIDVAPSYIKGHLHAEEMVGPVMKTRRDEVFLTVKTTQRTKEGAARELRESLRTLHTDHFDMYKLHALDAMEEADEVLTEDGALAAFLEAKEQGLIRYIGITSHCTETMARMLNAFDFDSILVPLNPFDRFINRAEAGVIPQARSRNAAVIAMKPWRAEDDVPDAETAIRYALSRPISVLLPRGFPGRVEEAIKVAREYDGFSRQEEERLLAWYGNWLCRQCNYCTPCPKGIDIPLLFRLEGYQDHYFYGSSTFTGQYAALPIKADACDECGECEKRCPFEIRIAQRLREVHGKLSA